MSQVLTYDTVVGRELGLQDRMTALRNLRPGTRLSWPEGDLSREVLRELLSLPESIDVLRWLEAERGAAVALLAIEQSLDMAGMMYGAQNRIVSGMLTSEQERQVHQSLQDKYGAMYGPLLRSDEDWGAPKQRGDTVDGPPEHRHLVDALTRLRRLVTRTKGRPAAVPRHALRRGHRGGRGDLRAHRCPHEPDVAACLRVLPGHPPHWMEAFPSCRSLEGCITCDIPHEGCGHRPRPPAASGKCRAKVSSPAWPDARSPLCIRVAEMTSPARRPAPWLWKEPLR